MSRVVAATMTFALLGGVVATRGSDHPGSDAATRGVGAAAESAAPETTSAEPVGTGKTACDLRIGYVDIFAQAAIQQRFQATFGAAAEAAGFEVSFVDGAGTPDGNLAATTALVNEGVDAILFSSVPAEWVRTAVEDATSKGIPTVNIVTPATEGLFDMQYTEDEGVLSAPLVEYLIENLQEGDEVGLLQTEQIIASTTRSAAIEAAVAEAGATVVARADIPQDDPVEAPRRATTSMIQANPDLDAIVGVFDWYTPAVVEAMESLESELPYYSYYADAVNVPFLLRENSPLRAVADGDIARVTLVAADQLLRRLVNGEEMDPSAWDPMAMETLLVTADALPAHLADNPEANDGPVPISEMLAPYAETWAEEFAC